VYNVIVSTNLHFQCSVIDGYLLKAEVLSLKRKSISSQYAVQLCSQQPRMTTPADHTSTITSRILYTQGIGGVAQVV
jgi:hypothetical protein